MRMIGEWSTAAMRQLPPEVAHRASIQLLATGLGPRDTQPDDPVLASQVWGRVFRNPVGLAAGYDKNAEALGGLFNLGFGSIEVGTVTPRPQAGNPQPRLFRLKRDRAIINRMGFNNDGRDMVLARLTTRPAGILGVNVGCNRDSADPIHDFVEMVASFAPMADYLVINVSSPNTPGLRALQGREALTTLLGRALDARPPAGPPLLVKISPDLHLNEEQDVAEVCLAAGIDGMIVCNTTQTRPHGLERAFRDEIGGLSGAPLRDLAMGQLRRIHGLTGGRLPLIAAGGIETGHEAYARIRAGASLVQIYSALVYHGPALIRSIKDDLAAHLKADGHARLADAVGADTRA